MLVVPISGYKLCKSPKSPASPLGRAVWSERAREVVSPTFPLVGHLGRRTPAGRRADESAGAADEEFSDPNWRSLIVENPERLLTPGEVALMFRVDPKTVTRWASAGRIGSIRTPGGHRRFRESEVNGLLADLTVDSSQSTA